MGQWLLHAPIPSPPELNLEPRVGGKGEKGGLFVRLPASSLFCICFLLFCIYYLCSLLPSVLPFGPLTWTSALTWISKAMPMPIPTIVLTPKTYGSGS
jgi:hypothetical protein